MFFDGWISFLSETTLFLAVCVCLNSYNFEWHTFGDGLNSLLSLIFGGLLLVFPVFNFFFYRLERNYIQITNRNEVFLQKYGS